MKRLNRYLVLAVTFLFLLTGCGVPTVDSTQASTEIPAAVPSEISTEAPDISLEAENSDEIADSEIVTPTYVEVDAGTLIGFNHDDLYYFRGVQYATAERFKDPVPVTEYRGGEATAFVYGPVSPQSYTLSSYTATNPRDFTLPGGIMTPNENCQYLNVWTKDLDGSKPVIVFIHGGGLVEGASNELNVYNGEHFARREDVVFVSINHRLNALGFLDLSEYGEEYANSGLVGLKDCIEALKWVNRNIEAFGGDPSNVTIVGQSGGAAKVSALACMSDAQGLFDKVVVMSGNLQNTLPHSAAIENTQKLVDYLGLSDDEVIDTLTAMSYEELYNTVMAAGANNYNITYGDTTFEAPLFDENGVINPYAAERIWMYGTTFSEFNTNVGAFTMGMDMSFNFYTIENAVELFATNIVSEESVLERLNALYGEKTDAIIDAYTKAYPQHKLSELLFINNMAAGGLSRYAQVKDGGLLELYNNQGVTVYNYLAAYTKPFFGGTIMAHTDDITFWFNSLDEVPVQVAGDEEAAYKVAHEMADALAAFAASGDPSTDSLKWEPYTQDSKNTMIFDRTSEQLQDFDAELNALMFEP